MESLGRRNFVEAVGAAAGSAWLGAVPLAGAQGSAGVAVDKTVHLSGDGLSLSTEGYANLLAQLCRGASIGEDTYLLGGEVERFERHCADLLGKETAVFIPSGTLANQLALRALAGTKRRVIVQDTSHIYNDTGDACQTLSADTGSMSVAQGGVQNWSLHAGGSLAGNFYFVGGSLSGTAGIPAGSVVIPLTLDSYTVFSLGHPNQPPLINTFGTLDGSGNASASFSIGAGLLPPSLTGTQAYHAYAVLDLGLQPVLASNFVTLSFVP